MKRNAFRALVLIGLATAALGVVTTASAGHSWGGYHWPRSANPITIPLGDNVTSAWDAYLAAASTDWSTSSVLDTDVVVGQSNPRTCKPTAGRVEVCNARYGNNGWLGIAQIWISGSHISQGAVKLNDTYFGTSKYNTPAWRQMVVCQEVGHTFGLGHTDENFYNADLLDGSGKASCMDYSADPSDNTQPNLHDFDQLALIYGHLDAAAASQSSSPGASGQGAGSDRSQEVLSDLPADARPENGSVYVTDLGGGRKLLTHVFWVPERAHAHDHE